VAVLSEREQKRKKVLHLDVLAGDTERKEPPIPPAKEG
jgi:hypothetical protein